MQSKFTNNTDYPVLGLVISYKQEDGDEPIDAYNSETIMPGETSGWFGTTAPSDGNLENMTVVDFRYYIYIDGAYYYVTDNYEENTSEVIQWRGKIKDENGQFKDPEDDYSPEVMADQLSVEYQVEEKAAGETKTVIQLKAKNNGNQDLNYVSFEYLSKESGEYVSFTFESLASGEEAVVSNYVTDATSITPENFELITISYHVQLGDTIQILDYDVKIDDYRVLEAPNQQ